MSTYESQMEEKEMEEVALSLVKAMKGIGTDENRIIKGILDYSNIQRQIIKRHYLLVTGKHLEKDLKSELSGHFLDVVLSLLMPVDEYEAKILKKAIKRVGTKEKKVIEILCTKDAQEIKIVKAAYKRIAGSNLEDDLINEDNGDLGNMFRSLATGGRAENHGYDMAVIKKDAQALYEAGQAKIGTDESEFVRILCSRSFAQLNATFETYNSMYHTDIEDVIKNEFSGHLKKALSTIVRSVRSKPSYFAEMFYKAIQRDATTKTKDLIQILIRRCDIDLEMIKQEYKRIIGRTMQESIEMEISGDLQKILLAIVNKK